MIEILQSVITNHILLAPVTAWLVAQILKWLINALVEKKFTLERLYGDGGMPSGHSATVTTLAAMCGWSCGYGSAIFAVSVIFAIIVMHDATGVRREAGKHATLIKQLADGFNAMFVEKDEQIKTEKLKAFIGHTPLQVIFGALLGCLVTTAYIFLFGIEYCFLI